MVSDVVDEMVAVAASRVTERGLGNVVTTVLDLESIDQPDATFDSDVCRQGLMFAVEPACALTRSDASYAPAAGWPFKEVSVIS